jgi:hypothetical protein
MVSEPVVRRGRPVPRVPRRAWVLVPVLLLLVGVVVVATARPDDPIQEALDVLADDSAFASATEAGAAFTRVSVVLQEAAEDACPAPDDGCDHLFSASAHSRVSGVAVLTCTRRGVLEARAALRAYLTELADDPAATMPRLPACAR